jgi:polysaccharide pyruvyl transferase WcaK-like protein/MoaA/NifB/PqqE/SkfB family radical SAM enzyme
MKLIDQLRFRWWEWADASPNPKQRLPTVIQFPVNDICNSQCQMCHIWQRKRDHDITPEELASVLADPLFREIRDVGINGGEPTLRKDLGELTQVLLTKLPRLRGLTLITNAIQERNVLRAIDDLGSRCEDAGVHLSVMVSIDGVGEVHDRVRGVAGNFVSADRVLDGLMGSSRVGSCLIGCTFVRDNIYDAENVLGYARSKGVYARFRVGIPHQRLYTQNLKDPFDLDAAQRYHLACFLDEIRVNYEKNPARRAFYLSLRNQIIHGAPRAAGCVWKNRGVTLTSRGDLAYCAVQSPRLGSLLHSSAVDLYWKNAAILREINESRCSGCLHDYDGVQDRRIILERTLRSSVQRLPYSVGVQRILRKVRVVWDDRAAIQSARQASPSATKPRPRGQDQAILLCGWYGTETLGDKAILSGLVSTLRGAGWRGAVDLASLEPYVSVETNREMPELQLRRIDSIQDARKRVAQGEYKLVAVAGGPLMSPVREVFDLLALFNEAAASKTRRAVLGCGVGPLGFSKKRDDAISRILGMSDETVFRDQASLDLARSRLGFAGTATVIHDPAFIWAAQQMRHEIQPSEDGPVLLALREWQIREYAVGLPMKHAEKVKETFERELVEMVAEFHRLAPVLKLQPFAMNTYAPGGDDRLFFQRIFAGHPELLSAIRWKRVSPHEDLAVFRKAKGIVAMRFHSAVLAIASGIPHVAIDYTRGGKIASLLSSVHAEQPLALEGFSGRACAERLLDAMRKCPVSVPAGVEEAYTSAWGRCLSELSD